MTEALNNQYRVLSDRQMHFGRLYWQCIAVNAFGLILVFSVFRDLISVFTGAAFVFLGCTTVLMGFVTQRLRILEKQYEELLSKIEEELLNNGNHGIQRAPKSGQYGARFVINLMLYLLGLCMIVFGLIRF